MSSDCGTPAENSADGLPDGLGDSHRIVPSAPVQHFPESVVAEHRALRIFGLGHAVGVGEQAVARLELKCGSLVADPVDGPDDEAAGHGQGLEGPPARESSGAGWPPLK